MTTPDAAQNKDRFSWSRREPGARSIPQTLEEVILLLQSRLDVHQDWLDWFRAGDPEETARASAEGVGTAESQEYYIAQYRASIEILRDLQLKNESMTETALKMIADERARQISKGWDAAHDDTHTTGDLVLAGMAYAHEAIARAGNWHNFPRTTPGNPPRQWPFEKEAWRPEESSTSNLVKAIALMTAELERQLRDQP